MNHGLSREEQVAAESLFASFDAQFREKISKKDVVLVHGGDGTGLLSNMSVEEDGDTVLPSGWFELLLHIREVHRDS